MSKKSVTSSQMSPSEANIFFAGKYFFEIFWSQSVSVKSTKLKPDFGASFWAWSMASQNGSAKCWHFGDPVFSELSHFLHNSLVTLRGGVISRGFALYMEGGVSERNMVWRWNAESTGCILVMYNGWYDWRLVMISWYWISSTIASVPNTLG